MSASAMRESQATIHFIEHFVEVFERFLELKLPPFPVTVVCSDGTEYADVFLEQNRVEVDWNGQCVDAVRIFHLDNPVPFVWFADERDIAIGGSPHIKMLRLPAASVMVKSIPLEE